MATNEGFFDVLAVSRKVHRFLTVDGALPSAVEYRNVWETASHDRRSSGAMLITLITKLMVAGYVLDDTQLPDIVNNMITDRPLVPQGTPKTDAKKAAAVRQVALHTIVLVVLHYPINVQEPFVQLALRRWNLDLGDNPSEHDVPNEAEAIQLVQIAEALENDKTLVDIVLRAVDVNSSLVRDETAGLYNSANAVAPGGKVLQESLLFPLLVAAVRRGAVTNNIVRYAAQQLVGVHETLAESRFMAVICMLREFFLTNPLCDADTLDIIQDTLRPYFVWPSQYSSHVVQITKYCESQQQQQQGGRKPSGVVKCWNFLEHHPHLMPKSDHNSFIVVNPNSAQGLAVRELLRETSATHVLPEEDFKLKFVFNTLLNEDVANIQSLSQMDDITVQSFFDRIMEIVHPAFDAGQLSTRLSNTLKAVKKEIEDNVYTHGLVKQAITSAELIDYAPLGTLAANVVDIDEGNISLDRVTAYASDVILPEVGGLSTLSKILSPFADTKRPVLVKIGIAGGDSTVQNILCGYAALRHFKPELFTYVKVRFYIIPAGNKLHFASLLGLHDLWYSRQVTMQLRALLFTLPAITRVPPRKSSSKEFIADGSAMVTSELKEIVKAKDKVKAEFCSTPTNIKILNPRSKQPILGSSPATLTRGLVDHYLRVADATLNAHVFLAEIYVTVNGTQVQRRMVPFVMGVELGTNAFNAVQQAAVEDAKQKRTSVAAPKPVRFQPPEVTIKMSEMNVAGTIIQSPQIPSRPYTSIQISNAPRSADQIATVNPANSHLELYLVDTDAGRRAAKKTQGGIDEGLIYYIATVEIEDPNKRPFDLLIDERPFAQVSKVRIIPLKDPIKPVTDSGQDNPFVFPVALFSSLAS